MTEEIAESGDINKFQETPLTLAELTGTMAIAPEGADDKDFNELAKTRSFLPRITMLQATSKEVAKKKAAAGDYVLSKSKDDIEKLSDKFIGIPLAFRFKAVDMRIKEKILNYYDQKSAEFLAIKEVAKTGGMTGCMAGIEFLFWLPEQEVFATWYASSVTALGEAQSVRTMIGKAVWMKSKYIEAKEFSWYGPTCVPCSETAKQPDLAAAKTEIEKFIKPKSSEIEAVSAEEAKADDRAR